MKNFFRIQLWNTLALVFTASAAHWKPEAGSGVRHGPQVWAWWRLVSFWLVPLGLYPPSRGRRLWIYTRWGALYFDFIADRRDSSTWNGSERRVAPNLGSTQALAAKAALRVAVVLLVLLILGALVGCGQDRDTVKHYEPPQVVHVTVTKYVPVPDNFTKDCPIAEPRNRSVDEAVNVANARKKSLQDCNADKAAIRGLSTTPPPASTVSQP